MAFNYREYQTSLENQFRASQGGRKTTRTVDLGQWKLDPSRGWKLRDEYATETMGDHGKDSYGSGYLHVGQSHGGKYAGLDRTKYGTGVYDMYSDISDRARYKNIGKTQILDWTAYDKDFQYKAWLDREEKSRFTNLQEILDAEDWIVGGMQPLQEAVIQPVKPEPEPEPYDWGAYRSQFQDQIDTLEDKLKGFDPGPVPDLDSQLANMRKDITSHLSATYKGNLEDFKASDWIDSYVNKQGFATVDDMAAAGTEQQKQLAALKDVLSGQLTGQGADIGGLQKDLQSVRGDLGLLSGKWGDVSTNIDELRSQLRGQASHIQDLDTTYDERLRGLDENLSGRLQDFYGHLGASEGRTADRIAGVESGLRDTLGDWTADKTAYRSRVEDQFRDLNTSTQDKIAEVRGDLGQDLSQATLDLRNELGLSEDALRGELSSTRDALTGQLGASEAALRGELGQTEEGLRRSLSESEARTGSQIAGVSQLQQQQGGQISQLGSDLLSTASGLQGNIDKSKQALDDRLTKLSSQFNYRMLGDSAEGVRMRKSRARESGDTAFGTGQLNRSMQISALNL